jgi:hypothetical protein
MNGREVARYPLLEEILHARSIPFQATYSTADVARIFGVSPRAIQHRMSSGQLVARDLPGRARFLPGDIEAFIAASDSRTRALRFRTS